MLRIAMLSTAFFIAGCASQSPQPTPTDGPVTNAQQQANQAELTQPTELTLKRKLAVGRLSNETNYGRSLLRSAESNALDKKISDMFMQSVLNTNAFLVFERPDLALIEKEAAISGETSDLIGVDTLVIGSLTEFGRSTTGERGFLSSSQKQQATATVDLRLVEVKTGQVIASVTGTGASSTEQSRTMGFGSVSGYNGSLNDQAIGAAVNAAVAKMTQLMINKPWRADILAVEGDQIYISGGAAQGVKADMTFTVAKKGKQVRSSTTGGTITLPSAPVGTLKVLSTFGDAPLEQGAIAVMVDGSIDGIEASALEITKSASASVEGSAP